MIYFYRKGRAIYLGRLLRYMKSIIRFLEKKKKIKDETRWHTNGHVGYWSKKMSDDSVEFWAHPMAHTYGDMKYIAGTPVYLGKCEDNDLTKSEDFYNIYISHQRGAIKMWKMMGIYE